MSKENHLQSKKKCSLGILCVKMYSSLKVNYLKKEIEGDIPEISFVGSSIIIINSKLRNIRGLLLNDKM